MDAVDVSIADVIRAVSTAASLLVIAGFLVFATDELNESSAGQVRLLESPSAEVVDRDAIDRPDPLPAVERAREAEHSGIREALDDANDVLLSPFMAAAPSDDVWVLRLVPGLIALGLYGFALRMLANALPKPKRREPTGFAQPSA